MSGPELLPSCFALKTVWIHGVEHYELSCASCPATGGVMRKDDVDRCGAIAFYLCDVCAAKHGEFDRTKKVVPQEVVYAKAREAMLENEGRLLTTPEVVQRVDDPTSYLAKLLRDLPGPK